MIDLCIKFNRNGLNCFRLERIVVNLIGLKLNGTERNGTYQLGMDQIACSTHAKPFKANGLWLLSLKIPITSFLLLFFFFLTLKYNIPIHSYINYNN